MFVLYDAMQKRAILMINVFEYYLRVCIEGGYYFFRRTSAAGIIRVWVLFEGGSYVYEEIRYVSIKVQYINTACVVLQLP